MKRKYTIISLCAMSILAVGMGFLYQPKPVSAEEFTIDLFESYGAVIETAYDDYSGLKVSAKEKDDAIALKDIVAGRMEIDYATLDSTNPCDVIFTFTDVSTKDKVELYLDFSAADVNASVLHGDDRVGLYYGGRDVDKYNKGLQGRTKGANADGHYTIVESKAEHSVVFDPESYSFYIDDTLIWSFVLQQNDGTSADLLNGFEEYKLEIAFDSVNDNNGGVILKEINGTSLKNYTYSTWKTSLVVLNNLYAYDGVAYKIPKPYLYNIADGLLNSEKVQVSVFDSNMTKILENNYAETLSFVPDATNANYRLEYKYTDDNGSITKNVVNVSCYDGENVNTEYVLSSNFQTTDLGLNAQIYLPKAKVESEIFVTGQSDDVLIDVYKDGIIYGDYQALSAKQSNLIAFNDVGEYTVRYYSTCDYVVEDYQISFNVTAALLAYDNIDVDEVLAVDTKLSIPDVRFYFNGETYETNASIIFPSGRSYANKLIVLDEIGQYTLRYTALCEGTEYIIEKVINVLYTGETMFDYDSGLNSLGFGTSATTDNIKGIHVVTTANNAEVTYKEKIDLNKLNRDVPLIELFGDAKALGEEAFTKFVVKLIDAYDSSNVVTITCEAKLTEVNGSYIKAGATGQSLLGYWDGTPNLSSGFPSLFDFQGETNGADIADATFSISMDYAERKLYSLNAYNPTVAAETDYCITDLDDPDIYTKPWAGFTTGECYVSIAVSGMAGSSVSYTIMTIAGKSISENFVSVKDAPQVSVDLNGSAPIGCVEVAYPIFNATAKDYYLNNVDVKANVYYAYGKLNQAEINLVDGKFTPTLVGTYTICYTATDVFGNITKKIVNVEIEKEQVDIVAEWSDGVTQGFVGEKIAIKSLISLNGGNGEVQQKIEVKDSSGNACTIKDGRFIPETAGDYTVTYTLSDYLGQTVVETYTIAVAVAEKPMLTEEIILPNYFVSGIEYQLPEVTAMDYTDGQERTIYPEIYVTDKDGRHLLNSTTYMANVGADGENVVVEYVYTSSNGGKEVVQQTIKGVVVKNGNKIQLEKYFVGQDVSFDKNDGAVLVIAEKSGAQFTYAKALFAENLNLFFSITPEQFNASTFKLTLTDAYNAENTVEFDFRFDKTTQKVYASLNNGLEKAMPYTLVEDGKEISFGVSYDYTAGMWMDVSGKFFENATAYANGKNFVTLPEFVYFDVQFGKMTEASVLNIKQLNNQTFNNLTRDVIAPEVKLGELNTNVSLGDVVTIPKMEAYDVLGYVYSKKVTVQYSYKGQVVNVTDENGALMNNVDASIPYNICLDKYGEYIITYVAEDNSGRSVKIVKNIALFDAEKAEITVQGTYKDEYNLNEQITIHAMTVQDNLSETADLRSAIYVIDAHGVMHQLQAFGGSYKFVSYGKHIIRYFVIDEAGNITIKDFIVMIV